MSSTASTILTIILIVLAVAAVILVVLYFVGRKMQARQTEQEAALEANKITVSMLIIDKKKMKLSDANFPKVVDDALKSQKNPLAKIVKYPVVKAKVGPKIMTLMADPQVFDLLPVKAECKVVVSGIYITKLISIRGQSIAKPEAKKNIFAKMKDKLTKKKEEAEAKAKA